MILIKDRRFHWRDGMILCRRNRSDPGVGGVNRQSVGISDDVWLSGSLLIWNEAIFDRTGDLRG